jgi:hypothetical protein
MLFAIALVLPAVIIDRIAIVVRNSIIKDSDVNRDIRVTDFLNGRPLNFSASARKEAADRLIAQALIRREIRLGDYPMATLQDADEQLDSLESERFKTQAALDRALERYGLTELDLRTQFQWQLTVLRFIDLRFKPAVMVTDQEADAYYREHEAELRHDHPKQSLDELKSDARDVIVGERVNKLFFDWLNQQRGDTKIVFHEASLK